MAARMTAFKDWDCAGCGGDIKRGDEFTWGRNKGDKLCAGCSGENKIVQIDDAGKVWSQYQKDFFKFVRESDRSGQLQAVAGSGKTTVIRRASLEVQDKSVKYLVFNKANAREANLPYAEGGMPPHVDSSTFHSAAWSPLARRLNLTTKDINKHKTGDTLEALVARGEVNKAEHEAWASDIATLVGLAKNHGLGVLSSLSFDHFAELVDHFGIEFDQPEVLCGICGEQLSWGQAKCLTCNHLRTPETDSYEDRAIEVAMMTLQASNEDLTQIDYDDMLYLALKLHISLPRYDIVFIDESQDVNPTRRALLRGMVKEGGRCISVGDSRQAVYGFTGSEADSMDKIAQDWNAVSLPLSINYRCSKAVIRTAQAMVPEIEAWDGAPEGSVETLTELKLSDLLPTDAILCRVNAPNISLAYRLIAAGIPCQVLGRDIGAGLVALVKKLQGKGKKQVTLDELLERCDKYQAREEAKWTAKKEEDKAQAIVDKCESLRAAANALPEGSRTVKNLIDRLENLFSERGENDDRMPRVTLCSCHKSKGLQFKRVFILDPWRMPSKWARQAWQLDQENNLAYIAVTRAQEDLRYINATDILG